MSGACLRLRACLFELVLGARCPQVWLCWCGSAWLVAGSGPRHFHLHICDEACVRLGRCLVEISIKNLRGLVHWIVASALSRWRDVALAGGVYLFRVLAPECNKVWSCKPLVVMLAPLLHTTSVSARGEPACVRSEREKVSHFARLFIRFVNRVCVGGRSCRSSL